MGISKTNPLIGINGKDRLAYIMKKWNSCLHSEMPAGRRLMHILLLVVGLMELQLITMEGLWGYVGYYLVENYLVVPGLLFLGIALTQGLTWPAKEKLILGALASAWFVVVQVQHRMNQVDTFPFGMLFFAWLMAFPFAAVSGDEEKNTGLGMIGKLFAAASLILAAYTLLLVLDCMPAFLAPFVFWDGTRLHAMWHPNVSACIFMIGIGFCLSFWFQSKTVMGKALLGAAVAAQFLAMALTNCRTTLLMTCALIGGTLFFAILRKGGWKRLLAGFAVALVVMVGLFTLSSTVYERHAQAQTAKLTALLREEEEQEAVAAAEIPAETQAAAMMESSAAAEPEIPASQNYSVNSNTGEVTIHGVSGQGSLSNDLRTLNGRTGIWKAALTALRDQKSLLLWGTEYVGLAISVYNSFPVEHAHNSWMEVLMRLGIPGLLAALAVTWIAVRSAWVLLWNRQVDLWKKVMAMLVLCVMVAGFLEPYLFITRSYYQFIDFIFFFCTGYLDQWRRQVSG